MYKRSVFLIVGYGVKGQIRLIPWLQGCNGIITVLLERGEFVATEQNQWQPATSVERAGRDQQNQH